MSDAWLAVLLVGAGTALIKSVGPVGVAGRRLPARDRFDDRVHAVPPLVVGQPDDCAVPYGRMRHHRLLDLDGVDVEATGDHHVLGAVDDEQ